jgi:hypothetical protein
MGHVNVAFCKTDGCIIEHRAIDLNLPEHIAAWNTRAVDTNTRVVTVDQLKLWSTVMEATNSCLKTWNGFGSFMNVDSAMLEIRAIIVEVKP